jgi:hypothetical protein
MNWSALVLVLSILAILVTFFLQIAKKSEGARSNWTVPAVLSTILLCLNAAIQVGNHLNERRREQARMQADQQRKIAEQEHDRVQDRNAADQLRMMGQLLSEVRSLQAVTVEEYKKLPETMRTALAEDAQQMQHQLDGVISDISKATARNDHEAATIKRLEQMIDEARHSIQSFDAKVSGLQASLNPPNQS